MDRMRQTPIYSAFFDKQMLDFFHNSMTFGWLPLEVIPKRIKWRDFASRSLPEDSNSRMICS